jgi:hypothetical protein
MYCRYCGSENVSYIGIDDGGGEYGDSVVSIFHCDDCDMDIEGGDIVFYFNDTDEGYDCIMCGKPFARKPNECCSECEQAWSI